MSKSREEILEGLDDALRASMGDRHFRNAVEPLIRELLDLDFEEARAELEADAEEALEEEFSGETDELEPTAPEVMEAEAIIEEAAKSLEE